MSLYIFNVLLLFLIAHGVIAMLGMIELIWSVKTIVHDQTDSFIYANFLHCILLKLKFIIFYSATKDPMTTPIILEPSVNVSIAY